ncbi:tetratricopeptide repeat protein [Methylobacterium sp. J-067]|uniref:tetratricopeptide repeat protein n=1 Tax=Methylobacterium sp. J-067 TaxID=2836648 RepID=UPI001FB990A5|nr:tetratricopeptide repeat protein [Methylobacterium sp. J-067]MCJ2023215.1 sel1 repeat family protein [Methylobacterium sp. J-067]
MPVMAITDCPAGDGFAAALDAFCEGAYAQARGLLEPLANGGHAEAQAWLGALHANGLGVPASPGTAFAWYRRAAEQGHLAAATNVGAMLAMGQGVARDRGAALIWLERAAEGGDTMACYNLATLLAKGDGIAPDPARAAALYRRAAETGHYPSQARLGHLYAHGIGVAQDRVEGFAWLTLAARHGVGTALTALEAVIREMSAEEKRRGTTRAQSLQGGGSAQAMGPSRLNPIPA